MRKIELQQSNTTYIAELHDKTAEEMVKAVSKAIKLPIKTTKVIKANLRLEIYYEEVQNVRPDGRPEQTIETDRKRKTKRKLSKQRERHPR